MYYTYILKSNKDGKFYTGATSDLRKRLEEHNRNEVRTTKGRGPFEIIYYEACKNEHDAFIREKYLKSGQGKRFLKNRIKRFLFLTGQAPLERSRPKATVSSSGVYPVKSKSPKMTVSSNGVYPVRSKSPKATVSSSGVYPVRSKSPKATVTSNGGFIALTSAIIISAILMGFAATVGANAFHSRFDTLNSEYKRISLGLAESCINTSLLKVVQNYNYSPSGGGEIIFVGLDSQGNPENCTIEQVTYGAEDPITHQKLASITASAEFHGAYSSVDTQAMVRNPAVSLNRGTLFIVTQVVNNNSGVKGASDFTVTVSGGSPIPSTFNGSEQGVLATINSNTSYSVSQTGPAGYIQTSSSACSSALGLVAGELKTCVIIEDDVPTTGTISIIANIKNNDGGTKTVTDFPLFIDATQVTNGVPKTLPAGTYNVLGSSVSGYNLVSKQGYCDTVVLSVGQNKTCILTYDDIPPPAPICADTVMIFDRTGSMSASDLTNERNAGNGLMALYSNLTPHPQVGVGSFGAYPNQSLPGGAASVPLAGQLNTIYTTITTTLNNITDSNSSVGSDLSAAIIAGNNELNSARHLPGFEKVLLLVSDGVPNQPSGTIPGDTGFKVPTANIQNGVGDLWTNPANAYANGGGDANNNLGNRHRYYNFGFGTFPSGATITGIEASVDAWSTTPVATTSNTLTPSGLSIDEWDANTGTEVSAVSSNNGDTSYIDTSSSLETFAVPNSSIPAGAVINSVTINAVARGASAGASMQLVTEKGGVVNVGSNITLTTSYTTYSRTMTTDPSTGVAWTLAEVNAWASRFGVRTTGGSPVPRVTQLYVVVDYTPTPGTVTPNPTAVANYDQWTANGSANKTTDILTNDGDSNYISESTLNDAETYTFAGSAVPLGATITGITVSITARYSSAGPTVKIRVEKGTGAGSQSDGPTITPTNGYQTYTRAMPTNPLTGLSWTLAEVNAWTTKFGVIKTNSSGTVRVTEINLSVNYTLPSSQITLTPSGLSIDEWDANTGTEVSAVSSNNGDTSYIDTSSSLETFAVPNSSIPAGAVINSVTINAVARGASAGASMQLVTEKGGVVNVGSNITLTTSYTTYSRTMTTDPSTGVAWTLAEVNAWASRFGVRTTGGSPVPRVTQLYVVVDYSAPAVSSGCQIGVDLSWNGGTTWSNEKTATLTGTETTYVLGNSSDDWSGSHTWTTTEFSDTNFRARVRDIDPGASCLDTATTHLDFLELKTHYTTSVDPTQAALNAADTAKLSGTQIFTIHYGDATGQDLLAKLASGSTANPPHQSGSFANPGGTVNSDTGYISPSLQATTTGGTGNGFEITPTNAFADGGGNAGNINGAGDRHIYYGYNFIIPPNATIGGIVVRPDWWSDSTSGTNSLSVELSWNGGTTWTAVKTQGTESTTDTNGKTVGASNDTWGRTWALSEFDSSKFRVRLTSNCNGSGTCNTRDFFLDWLPVRVYYTVIAENSDNDNFFISPTTSSTGMQEIFHFIGSVVCPAAANPPIIILPTNATVFVATHVVNDNIGTFVASDFTMNVTAVNPTLNIFAGLEPPGISVTIDPGAYNIDENNDSGYVKLVGAGCSGTAVAGDVITCVVTNDDLPPSPPSPPSPSPNIDLGSWIETP